MIEPPPWRGQAALEEARIEYQGSLKLKEQGLQSETAIANSAARLEAARAQLLPQRAQPGAHAYNRAFRRCGRGSAHEYRRLRHPRGGLCHLIDLDPMLVLADVTEAEVETGAGRSGVRDHKPGREIEGVVTFVGKQSDPVTRTYPVEMTVENADYSIRSGSL